MITAIIFDCFGVLYQGSVGALYERAPEELHGQLDDIRIQRDRGYLNYEEYLTAITALLGLSGDEARRMDETSHLRNEQLFDYLRTIDRSRYKVGMLSNIGDETIEQLFTEAELAELFDDVVLSYQVGMVKPEPGIFELMATRLDATAEECLMIDDIEENCRGAESVGMRTVVYRAAAQAIPEIERVLAG